MTDIVSLPSALLTAAMKAMRAGLTAGRPVGVYPDRSPTARSSLVAGVKDRASTGASLITDEADDAELA